MSEYTLLERLANYLDPSNIPEEILTIQKEAMKIYFAKVDRYSECEKDTQLGWGNAISLDFIKYQNTCCGSDERCKVILI